MEKENTIKRIPKYKVSLVTEKALDAIQAMNDFYSAVYDMIKAYYSEFCADPDIETEQRIEKEFYPLFTVVDDYVIKFTHDYIDSKLSDRTLTEI